LRKLYSISWKDGGGITCSAQAVGVDVSPSGVGLSCPREIRKDTEVYIEGEDGHPKGYSVVRYCRRSDDGYRVGLELNEETRNTNTVPLPEDNYYEFLQISPRAESETIYRIYRFLATRYHPDNPKTGDPEKFVMLNRAFEVLSDPQKRAEYDSMLDLNVRPNSAFDSIDFMDGPTGEVNRRLAVLSVLYRRCRANMDSPRVSLAELETVMGFPREYLDFTTWYLRKKNYITREDNSDFALTVLGVDYVEANYSKLPVLHKLLSAGRPTDLNGSEKPPAGQKTILLPVDSPDEYAGNEVEL
jgi:hypothetical protein